MAKIWQQIGFDEHIFNWLAEEKRGRRHKNISETVNELMRNYQYLVQSMERTAQKQERMIKNKEEAEKTINNYREQIIKAKPLKEV